MNTTLTLVDLGGAIALLIWGVHMVQTGITRAFGPQLRRMLSYALGNRFKAFLAGLGVTSILQSSTATGLMVTAFAAGGLVDLVPALAVMLGANVGTTLIVQVLSFDVSRVSFLLILIGVLMFRRSGVTRTRDLGRVGIGLGLMLIALQHLLAMITPYEDVPSLRMLLGAVTTDPLIDILLAAGLTWAAHSSVAVVLLIMAFAAQGVVPPHAAFALVLGANLGTALNPLLESGVGGDPAAKRLPIGNLINRIVGCALALALLNWIGPALVTIEPDAGRAVADFHTGFNIVLALLFFPLLKPFARLLVRLLPARVDTADPSQPLYLDWAARETPSIALAGAAREALRMVDVFEAMLRGALDSLDRGDRKRVTETARMDNVLDRLDTRDQGIPDLDRYRRSRRHRSPASVGNPGIHDQPRACRRHRREEPDAACRQAHQTRRQLLGNQPARDPRNDRPADRQRTRGRGRVHDRRPAGGPPASRRKGGLPGTRSCAQPRNTSDGRALAGAESIEMGKLLLDIVRDLKRVNAHLAAAAYPILEGRGELLPSRLKQD